MSNFQIENVNAQQYQYDYLDTFLRWVIIIVLFVSGVYGVIYVQRPSLPLALTTLSFFLILPLAAGGMHFLRKGQLRKAIWLYLISTLFPATAFTLFATDRLLLVGFIGYILLIRIAIFMETTQAAFVYSIVCVFLYIVSFTVRLLFSLPTVQLGQAEVAVLYILPVLGVVLFTLLDRIGSRYLRESLTLSEASRQGLANSYALLQEQTDALTQSEAALSELARQLEKNNEELKIANEEVRSFAYITSHDLRSPLINLKGFAAELRLAWTTIRPVTQQALPQLEEAEQTAVNQALEEDMPEALMFIDTAVTRMDSFLNALLRLSRLGQRPLFFEQISMDEIVQTTLGSLAHQIASGKVTLHTAALPEIVADKISMEQIMDNLLGNAVNYLSPERPGKIEIWGEETAEDFLFYVRDNGCGVAEMDMNRLFEPFRRIGRHDISGEGMGLAYVQTLVRRHDGRVWCESKPDVGSTFTFTISKNLENENKYE